jgi:hypothetical protein
MRHRHARFVLILLAAIVLVAAAPRLVIDPYRVFGLVTVNQRNFEPNTRYLKVEHWRTCRTADSLVMGSSRSNFYSNAAADRLLGGQHYNFNVSGETIPGLDRRVRWLVAHCPVKQVLVALDYDFFQITAGYGEDALRRDHPILTGQSRIGFLLPYMEISWGTMRKTVSEQFKARTVYRFDLASGHVRPEAWDREMAAGTHRPWTEPGPFCPRQVGHQAGTVAVHLEILRDLAAWLRDRGVTARFVISPVSQRLTARFDADGYAAWAAGVAEAAGEVFQFGGFTTLNADRRDWYEESHFNAHIGTEILGRLARGGREGVLGRWTAAESGELAAALRANFAAQAARCS